MQRFSLLLPVIIFFSMSASAASNGFLIVANKGDETVGIIDTQAGKQTAAIPEGGTTAHELVASPDGKLAYVPIYGNSGVGKPGTDGTKMVVVDLKAHKVVNTLDFDKGVRPHCPMLNPKTGELYVTTELEQAVSIIDPKTLKVVGSIPTGQKESHMLAVSHDGRRGYTANVGPGTVSVLDLQGKKTITIIPISGNTQRISITPDDKMVFTADQTKPQMAVIDTATNKVKTWVPLPAPGYGTAVTPDGKWLVIAVPDAKKVVGVNLATMKVEKSIDVPAAPQEVLIEPGGQNAYVSCDKSGKVAMIGLANWKVEKLIDAGKTVDGLAWAK
jgi:YVTN family beta-propeller protein